jgi:mono/diheme cytochrome c family protein
MLLRKKTRKLIPSVLGTIALSVGLFSSASAQDGEAIFKQNCSSCHKSTEQPSVGPGLKGATERRSEDWILKFVKNPQAVMDAGDADALAMKAKFGMVMPPQSLSPEEIKAVFAFIDESNNAPAVVEVEKPVKVATAADILLGKQLFEGSVRFKNEGPSCISCHHVKYPDMLEGGRLAKDLSDCYARLGGESGLTGILSSPPFPAMTEAFKDKQITEEEAFALAAFFKDVPVSSRFIEDKYHDPLLEGGFIAFIIILVAISLIWFRRKKNAVKKDIFDRQTEAIN